MTEKVVAREYSDIIFVQEKRKNIRLNREKIFKEIPKEKLIKIYRNMVRTRKLDEKLDNMLSRSISLSQHSTCGQEATPVASIAALEKEDYIFPYHRGWAWAIGKGMDPKLIIAELLGKKTGYCKGKGGPHLASFELGVMGRSGVQAAHIPIAAGAGFAIRYKNEKKACIAFFGEGASDNGNFHEGLNLASIWKAPLIYICENNQYMQFDRSDNTNSVADIALRSIGYSIPGYIVDGNDALAVYHIASKVISDAKNGKGPSFIEAKTYRLHGHTGIDKGYYGGYRTKEEVDQWREKCPIERLKSDLLINNYITEIDMIQIEKDAINEMDEAEEFAVNSEYPDKDDYLDDIFFNENMR